jgi:hypothetical protein
MPCWLRAARPTSHLGGDLLSHLEGTEAILREWAVPGDVALAGLCRAAYGTDGFAPSLLTIGESPRLAAAIGRRFEQLVRYTPEHASVAVDETHRVLASAG